jgi:hypothetical protein
MPWGIAAAAVVGAYASNRASDKAADASQNATNSSIGEQRAARQEYQQNIAPYMQQGTASLGILGQLNAGNMDAFYESPDYAFARDMGLQGLDRSAAARGAVNSGGADADRIRFASGLASQNYGQFYDRQYNLAAMGQNAIAGQGSMAQQSASNIGNLLMGNAAAQGTAAIQQGNNLAGLANQLGGAYQQYQGRQSGYGGGYGG